MDRDRKRDETSAEDDGTVREGNVVIEEHMSRRDGLVQYEGTDGQGEQVRSAGTTAAVDTPATTGTGPIGGAMQAGATMLGGLEGDSQATTVGTAANDSDLHSMSTDNTAHGAMAAGSDANGPITQAREGMRVIDASGDDLGKVDQVHMGDPAAASAPGEEVDVESGAVDDSIGVFGPAGATAGTGAAGAPGGAGAPGALSGIGDTLFGGGGVDLPETLRNDLTRVGFIKIDGKGWFDTDHYARADQIADVSGDTVRLSVAKEALSAS